MAATTEMGIRGRQLAIMLQRKESTNRRVKRSAKANRDLRLAHRREFLVSLGVVDQSEANEKITDPDSPLATPLERKKEKALQERSRQRELKKRREDEEKIKQAYENAWLINMEKEMAEQGRRMEETQDDDERAVMKSLLEINSNKPRLHHQGLGTLKLPDAVEKRKSFCLDNQLVEQSR